MELDLALLDEIAKLTNEAGAAILDIYARGSEGAEAQCKDDGSPVTAADRAAHGILVSGLARLTPRVHVVSEEDKGVSWSPDREPWWLVDPLDGTKEFLKQTGEFTVNVALVQDGLPVGGVVYAPALGRTWIGGPEGGEVRENGLTRPLGIRSVDPSRLCVVASQDHAGPMVRRLLKRTPGVEALSMGSSLKFCLIAEGRADLYLRDGPTMEWDTGAAHAVLQAAGGQVFTMEGVPVTYGKHEFRNSHFVAVGDQTFPWRQLLELHSTGE